MNTALVTLQTLTDTAIDSAKGYELAADKATSIDLTTILRARAEKRRETVMMMNKEIGRLGGEPRDFDGTVLGDLHRIWVNITDKLGDSNNAAADNVEEGEDYIRDKFAAAIDGGLLKDEPKTLEIIKTAFTEIQDGERLTDFLEERYEKAA